MQVKTVSQRALTRHQIENKPMPESSEVHRVFIINEEGKAPFVAPKVLPVERGDQVLFVVAGEKDEFTVCPETDVFRSVSAGEDLPVELGSPPRCTVRQGIRPNSVHRYGVISETSGSIDPILVIYE